MMKSKYLAILIVCIWTLGGGVLGWLANFDFPVWFSMIWLLGIIGLCIYTSALMLAGTGTAKEN